MRLSGASHLIHYLSGSTSVDVRGCLWLLGTIRSVKERTLFQKLKSSCHWYRMQPTFRTVTGLKICKMQVSVNLKSSALEGGFTNGLCVQICCTKNKTLWSAQKHGVLLSTNPSLICVKTKAHKGRTEWMTQLTVSAEGVYTQKKRDCVSLSDLVPLIDSCWCEGKW